MKLKFSTLKDLVHRIQRQDTNWEKIFAKYIFNKGFVLRIYKNPWNKKKRTIKKSFTIKNG